MSIAATKREMLIDKRARALAIMMLTRRPDLFVEEEAQNDEFDLDYIVRFRTPGKEGLREFAIELKGAASALTKEQADKMLRPVLQQLRQAGPFLRPISVFVFTMENDSAWYTWAAAPEVTDDGQALLRLLDKPDCRQLTDRALDDIVKNVDAWYDAVFPSLVVNGMAKPGAKRPQRR